MSKVKLCDICDFQGGSQPPKSQWITLQQDGYIRMLQIRDFTQPGKVKAEYVKLTNTTKWCLKDDILIARYGASLGKILTGLSGAYNVAMTKAVPNEAVISKKFLYYFLCSDTFQNCILNVGVRAAQAGFNKEDLSNIEIYCPDLSIQNKICKILELVDILINKSKLQMDELDLLVKSRFIEMFGTFPDNPKGWECCTIRDIVKEVRYGSSRPAVEGGQYPYLRMNNITYEGTLDLSEIKYIDVPEKELEKCTVRKGDVLFNRTNSKELVGKTCLYDRDESMVLAGFIIRVRVNDKVVPEFLVAFLNMDFSKKMLFNKCKAAIGQANINAQELQNIEIYLPHLALQKEFVSLKYQVDKSKLAIQQSLDELETLKKSLMQQYFG